MSVMEYSRPFLGEIVSVVIDRPLGTKHPKHDYVYPVNYGYVPDTVAPDGAELDVYVLGEEKPLKEYTGRCIAIIHRTNDDDDKLIITQDHMNFNDQEIRDLTRFQEQWFESEIVRPTKPE